MIFHHMLLCQPCMLIIECKITSPLSLLKVSILNLILTKSIQVLPCTNDAHQDLTSITPHNLQGMCFQHHHKYTIPMHDNIRSYKTLKIKFNTISKHIFNTRTLVSTLNSIQYTNSLYTTMPFRWATQLCTMT